jgi:hypothetical protein
VAFKDGKKWIKISKGINRTAERGSREVALVKYNFDIPNSLKTLPAALDA